TATRLARVRVRDDAAHKQHGLEEAIKDGTRHDALAARSRVLQIDEPALLPAHVAVAALREDPRLEHADRPEQIDRSLLQVRPTAGDPPLVDQPIPRLHLRAGHIARIDVAARAKEHE